MKTTTLGQALPEDAPPDVLPLWTVRALRPCGPGYHQLKVAFPGGVPLDADALTGAKVNVIWAAHTLALWLDRGDSTSNLERYIQYTTALRKAPPPHGPDGGALTPELALAAKAARAARTRYVRTATRAGKENIPGTALTTAWNAALAASDRAVAEWLVALVTTRWPEVRAVLIAYARCRHCAPGQCWRCQQWGPACGGLCHACLEERGANHETSGDDRRRDGAGDPYWRGQGLPAADGSTVRVHNFVAHNVLYAARTDGLWPVYTLGGGSVLVRPADGDDGDPAGR